LKAEDATSEKELSSWLLATDMFTMFNAVHRAIGRVEGDFLAEVDWSNVAHVAYNFGRKASL
jgi:hypothetical protein